MEVSKFYKLQWIKAQLLEFARALQRNVLSLEERGTIQSYVRWIPPLHYWIKLNTDGSVKASSGRAGSGGLIKGNDGEWLGGFSYNIGVYGMVEVELWAIVKRLELASQLNFSKVVVESDSDRVINCLNRIVEPSSNVVNLVRRYWAMLDRE